MKTEFRTNKMHWGRRVPFILMCIGSICLMAFYTSQTPVEQHEEISYSKPGTGNSWTDTVISIFLKVHNKMNGNSVGSFTSRTLMEDTLPSDYEDLFKAIETLSNQKWERNSSSIRQFRQDLNDFHQIEDLRSRMIMNKNTAKPGDTVTCYKSITNYKITNELWQMFSNHSMFNSTKRFKKCNIVGSSGILRNSKCGQKIDDGDLVFRFNLPTLKNYSEDVGLQSDYVTANPSIVPYRQAESYKRIHGEDSLETVSAEHGGHALIPTFDVQSLVPYAMQLYRLRKKQPCAESYFLNPEHTLAHRNFWLNAGMEHILSSGFYFTSSALDICEEVHLYGFWPFAISLDGAKVPYHYFDRQVPYGHNFNQEYRVLVRMHQMGLIKLQLRPCL